MKEKQSLPTTPDESDSEHCIQNRSRKQQTNKTEKTMKDFVKRETIVARDSRAVASYMRDVAKYPLLTPAEEVDLAKRCREGDISAKEKLITSNLRFVLTVAHSYQGQGLSLGDLISEGNIGLQRAVKQYDPTRGFRFCSYAVWWIRQAIAQAIAQYGRMVRLPSNRQTLLSKVNRTQSELTQELGRLPSSYEIAERLHIDEEDVDAIKSYAMKAISLDSPQSEEDESPLGERLASKMSKPDKELMKESLNSDINEALSCLTEVQKDIIVRLYGLNGHREYSQGELSLLMNISQERVRQLHRNALQRLQGSSTSLSLKNYICS